jgi:hypothetical protein
MDNFKLPPIPNLTDSSGFEIIIQSQVNRTGAGGLTEAVVIIMRKFKGTAQAPVLIIPK